MVATDSGTRRHGAQRSPVTPRGAVRVRSVLIGVVLVALLAGCAASGPPLNSERIERQFGSYGVDVLRADGNLRVSSLYSGSGDTKVTRTFAVVRFAERLPPVLAREHAAVLAGQSLGAVFKSAGWQIGKQAVFIGPMNITEQQRQLGELMHIELPQELAVHVYWFVVQKDGRAINYANIVEIHHPDYLSTERLKEWYGEVIFDDSNRTSIDDFVAPELWKN